ncbi:hypothetical protein BOW16_09780 [Solemya velum gill symbiont]|uniref:Uncharacterized protein n=3 Tax=Solemya velum gill symbiont TaxID=2340 RepID=A0A1T2ESX3_SOVGS|nr:hypothetical protein BOV88_09350 [Solemya velum gill symbiont]OOY37217.1 hypothetical protein BOV89_08185 [Solemya velum gill symbiont]OOY47535.1 hypothetical protein BOV93_06025 [Solemya velum gill symbiont]OOY50162.1 hypothetical protein BOV94_07975 [Solemya velum gill symbiont]OOY52378.1 hypothetical protein BOV97_05230 [Solemya velum gill symbiont]
MVNAMKSRSSLLGIIIGLFLFSMAVGVQAAGNRLNLGIDGESTDDAHDKWIEIQSMDRVKAPQGAPEGTNIVGNKLQIHKGYSIKRISGVNVQVMKRDGSVTGTVSCDPCAGQGACTLSSSGGKLGCTSTCDKGCVTVIKIPLPKSPAQQLQKMR